MPVSVRIPPALDRAVHGDGVGAGIAFIHCIKSYRQLRRGAADHNVRDTAARSEVGMERFIPPDTVYQDVRGQIYRLTVDRSIPWVVVGKRPFAIQGCERTIFRSALLAYRCSAKSCEACTQDYGCQCLC